MIYIYAFLHSGNVLARIEDIVEEWEIAYMSVTTTQNAKMGGENVHG